MGQVEAVLQRQHATHVDTLAFAVDIGASEGQAAYGEGADFVVADLAYQPRTPAAPLFLQPVLRGRQCFAGRDRVVPATETGAWVGVQQDGVVALAGTGLFDGLLPGQLVRAGLIGMVGDGAAGQHQVAGPRGDIARLGRRRTRCDPLTAAAVVDAQAVTAARGVLQQVSADGHGQGFGGLDRFGAGFALKNTGNVLFAIQTCHELVVQQKQFSVAVNIQRITLGEFNAVVTLQCPGSHRGAP
ncbi:hypothetical protein D3C86_1223940 [compost metagenome]